MVDYAHCQLAILDDAGNLMAGASVEVRDEATGNLASPLYSTRTGSATIATNPYTSADGYVDFYVDGGAYKITATLGADTVTMRYRAIGTAAEHDWEAASEAASGVVELATDAETVTGTDTARATTPANLVAKMAAPGAIGGTTPAAGAFTTLSASGLITAAGGQIAFPASQSASADANTLDDYEEGTFTPTLTFGGGSTGLTYSQQIGVYTKIGNVVFAFVRILLSAKGSSTGTASVNAMPFTARNTANFNPHSYLYFNAAAAGVITTAHAIIVANTSALTLQRYEAGTSTNLTDTAFAATTAMQANLTYWV